MDDRDRKGFAEIWRACWESCGKSVTDRQLRLEFATLESYSIEEVRAGLTAHRRDPDAGQFPPKGADVIRQLDGGKHTAAQIIAAARKPQTALAVLCRKEITDWNLRNYDDYRLKSYAESCIAQIPEWRNRIRRGDLTEHEKQIFEKYGVDATAARLFQIDGESLTLEDKRSEAAGEGL